jgi:hypothetical protein
MLRNWSVGLVISSRFVGTSHSRSTTMVLKRVITKGHPGCHICVIRTIPTKCKNISSWGIEWLVYVMKTVALTARYELHLQTQVQQRLHAIFSRLGEFPNFSRHLKFPQCTHEPVICSCLELAAFSDFCFWLYLTILPQINKLSEDQARELGVTCKKSGFLYSAILTLCWISRGKHMKCLHHGTKDRIGPLPIPNLYITYTRSTKKVNSQTPTTGHRNALFLRDRRAENQK